MPRRAKRVKKHLIAPDAKYGSVDVAKFVNKIMLNGKKSTASRIVYGAMDIASQQVESEPVELLAKADLDLRGATAWDGPLVMEVVVARLARLGRR